MRLFSTPLLLQPNRHSITASPTRHSARPETPRRNHLAAVRLELVEKSGNGRGRRFVRPVTPTEVEGSLGLGLAERFLESPGSLGMTSAGDSFS